MMNIRQILSVATVVLLASGCRDTDLAANVSLKELASGESRTIMASLTLPQDCESDHRDTGVEATREGILRIFPNATYVECDPDLFSGEGTMRFRLPLAIDRTMDDTWSSEKHINLLSFDDVLLGMYVPPGIAREIHAAYLKSLSGNPRIGVTLRVTNDTGAAIPASFHSVFVDGVAVVEKDIVIEKGRTFDLMLGNVQVDTVRFSTPSAFVIRKD